MSVNENLISHRISGRDFYNFPLPVFLIYNCGGKFKKCEIRIEISDTN